MTCHFKRASQPCWGPVTVTDEYLLDTTTVQISSCSGHREYMYCVKGQTPHLRVPSELLEEDEVPPEQRFPPEKRRKKATTPRKSRVMTTVGSMSAAVA